MASQCGPGASITCPSIKQYPKEFLAAAAKEYAQVENVAPHLIRLVDDFGIQRDVIRKCIERRAKAK